MHMGMCANVRFVAIARKPLSAHKSSPLHEKVVNFPQHFSRSFCSFLSFSDAEE